MADDTQPTTPLGLPMQPTGSGITDLEIEREQAAIAGDEAGEATEADSGTAPVADVTASGAE